MCKEERNMVEKAQDGRGGAMQPSPKLFNLMFSDSNVSSANDSGTDVEFSVVSSASYRNSVSSVSSPYRMSPWTAVAPSPYTKSPWTRSPLLIPSSASNDDNSAPIGTGNGNGNGLIGSIVREEGHVYSLAASGELLYTGSDSKNIRVWKNLQEFSGFKSGSGLVKAIVIAGEKIFTGHQDGKIRIWKVPRKNPTVYKRAGSLPRFKDLLKTSINPNNYVQVRRHQSSIWVRHFDAISCLSLDENTGLLYSGSWDKTMKVWRVSDFKCMESITAHEDAINSVVVALDGLVLTGSADGTVKVWRRELQGKYLKHVHLQTLLNQESAVTSLAVSHTASIIYCGSSDGLVNFWEKEKNLSHCGSLRGHKLAVLCLAAAGNLVFSGSADKSICVWRRDCGAHSCILVLNGHKGPVKCLAVEEHREAAEDGRDRRWIVFSGSLDKSVKVWKVSEQPQQRLDHFSSANRVRRRRDTES